MAWDDSNCEPNPWLVLRISFNAALSRFKRLIEPFNLQFSADDRLSGQHAIGFELGGKTFREHPSMLPDGSRPCHEISTKVILGENGDQQAFRFPEILMDQRPLFRFVP
jgi:hypothetical protein